MRKLKTFATVMLVFAFIFVTACSGSDKPNNDPATNKNAETPKNDAAAPENTPEPKEPEEPKVDLGGREIRILLDDAEQRGLGGPVEGTKYGDMRMERQKEVEKKYNVKIVYEPLAYGQVNEKLIASGLAGEPVADIVAIDKYFAIPLINQGLLREVGDLFDFNDSKWPQGIQNFGAWNGKMYGFTDSVNAGSGIYYNKTLFKREGLPDPHQLVKEDKWNWDTFLDILKKATKDTDGDGNIDQWGIANHAPIIARIIMYANNGALVENRDGNWVFTGDEPNAVEAMRFLYDLVNTHKVMMPNKNGNFEDWVDSQTAFHTGKAAMVTGELWEAGGRKEMTDEFGFVYFPKGPKATEYANSLENFSVYFMPANVKQPEIVAQIWDELVLWEETRNIRKEFNERNLQGAEDVEAALTISDWVNPVPWAGVGDIGGNLSPAVWNFVRNGSTPESEMEKIKQPVQKSLDDILNKAKP
ncbi:ABC transporter substrate-binding protein [Paenibacillus mendelii]|uniref:ABC transporter substrate-binding protein n=1 Tax=Paenibacillus mendelii TaxID=206163 RepID=A0ABV6JBI0_9BACL|nr:extracellular solute-binding protein [Paenibacillus mendelii]MCQ6558620.1 extracellular solute-binding protein [Paenibacillus mendelii]